MRTRARALVAASATATIVGALALPADATIYEYKCNERTSSWGDEKVRLCILESTTNAFWGDLTYWNSTGVYQAITGTLIVQKCQAGGVNCVTITAMSVSAGASSNGVDTTTTSQKAGTYGYTYRTCASIESTSQWSFVFNCSPTNSYTPQ